MQKYLISYQQKYVYFVPFSLVSIPSLATWLTSFFKTIALQHASELVPDLLK